MSVSATTQRAADRTEPWGHRLKKVAIPCRSGAPCGWIKVKCPSWRALNSDANGASLKAPERLSHREHAIGCGDGSVWAREAVRQVERAMKELAWALIICCAIFYSTAWLIGPPAGGW